MFGDLAGVRIRTTAVAGKPCCYRGDGVNEHWPTMVIPVAAWLASVGICSTAVAATPDR